jgi:IMP dehydrogenase
VFIPNGTSNVQFVAHPLGTVIDASGVTTAPGFQIGVGDANTQPASFDGSFQAVTWVDEDTFSVGSTGTWAQGHYLWIYPASSGTTALTGSSTGWPIGGFLAKIAGISDLTVGNENTDMVRAIQLMKEKGGKKRLPYVDSQTGMLLGIYFKKDIQDKEKYPNMAIDSKGRLLVGAAIGVGDEGFVRAQALIKAGADILCIDTAQGDSIGVVEIIQSIKQKFPNTPIIAGNVVTEEGAQRLIDAGADAIKVGVGPGAICTTREMTGNGMPQFSAILEVARATKKAGVSLIADGGIKTPGDVAKAIAAGASAVMMGSVFSGTDEAPGIIVEQNSGRYKIYRGMGSVEAMHEAGGIGNDRYGLQSGIIKKVPEGISGLVPYKGPVQDTINKYISALIQSMRVYQGASSIAELQSNPKFVYQTQLGKIESGTRI